MRITIFFICFYLCLAVTSIYAETLTLKGSFFPGTKYVSPSFILLNNKIKYDIEFKDDNNKSSDIIYKLRNICNGNDNKNCEIIAEVETEKQNYIADGIIINISSINGLKLDDINIEEKNNFINKYNECIKSNERLSKLSATSTELMVQAESILNKNEIDQLREDFRRSHSIKENNLAEQISKERNISICDAYIELNIDFIDMISSLINEKKYNNDKIEINKEIDCSRFRFVRSSRNNIKGTYMHTYYYPENMDLQKVILNDKFNIPYLDSKETLFKSEDRKIPIFFKHDGINAFSVDNIYKGYSKITIIDSNGSMCILENKDPY